MGTLRPKYLLDGYMEPLGILHGVSEDKEPGGRASCVGSLLQES